MPVIIFSTKGGMTYQLIEKRYPDTIHKFWVDIKKGLDLQVLLTVAATLGINQKQSSLVFLIKNLWECFIQRDALKVEINPLVFANDGKLYAVNSFIRTDPAATYRQQEI